MIYKVIIRLCFYPSISVQNLMVAAINSNDFEAVLEDIRIMSFAERMPTYKKRLSIRMPRAD